MKQQFKISEEEFLVRSHEIDRYKKATLAAMVGFLQEAAWQNSAELGASVYDLQKMGFSWVLTRIKLDLFDYPLHRDRVFVRSWPTGHERTFVYRDYCMFDAQRNILAQATSTWLVLDLNSRRMTRVPEQFHQILDIQTDLETLPRAKDRLRMPDRVDHAVQFPVRWHDLDSNDHVSNFLFFQWPLEALADEWLAQKTLRSIDLIIKAEGKKGDTIRSEVAILDENTCMHSIKRISDGKEMARARTVWR
jgi:medium-chain acyl-[acyl-carrier-protein] hydrolase